MKKLKLLTIALVAVLLFGLVGCGDEGGGSSGNNKVNPADLVDFTVEVDDERDFVVLQLSDPQIVDSSQQRTSSRLGSVLTEYWAPEKMDDRCFNYLRYTIEQSNPDLIIITGDIVYGEFDDKGTSVQKFIEFILA